MFGRKILAAFFTSILAVVGLIIFNPISDENEIIAGVLVYSTYVVPIIFIYGIISSVVADKISFKAKNYKNTSSFLLHVIFGIGFILPYGVFLEYKPISELTIISVMTHPIIIYGLCSSVIFFTIDYLIKIRNLCNS